jgi:hypothetical protein
MEERYSQYKQFMGCHILAHCHLGTPANDALFFRMLQFTSNYEAGLIPDCPTTITLHPSYEGLVHRLVHGEPVSAQIDAAIRARLPSLTIVPGEPLASVYYPSTCGCGGKPCVAACRSHSPPQQR